MVAGFRRGLSLREVARLYRVALSTVQLWVERAGDSRLDRVDWSDRPSGAHHPSRKTEEVLEGRILALRKDLAKSPLGEFGAAAIRRVLMGQSAKAVPCERTIHRVLERNGALDARRRVRRQAPPSGWYMPDVASHKAEIDQIDIVTGLVIEGGCDVEVLNIVSVHGGLIGCFPSDPIRTQKVREALLSHWREHGLPEYAQFDNDTRFLGPSNHPGVIGSVARMCLRLGVVPVFAPPRETGFQAAIESLNNRWQEKVWDRFHHESLPALRNQSDLYVAASHQNHALRIEGAPARSPFPSDWAFTSEQLQAPLAGRIVFIRRTNNFGQLTVLGKPFDIGDHWAHRLVRCDLDLDTSRFCFVGLRRADPGSQPVLYKCNYQFPRRKFRSDRTE